MPKVNKYARVPWIPVVCGQCGKQWEIAPQPYKTRMKNSPSGKIFCGKPCFGMSITKRSPPAPVVEFKVSNEKQPKWLGIGFKGRDVEFFTSPIGTEKQAAFDVYRSMVDDKELSASQAVVDQQEKEIVSLNEEINHLRWALNQDSDHDRKACFNKAQEVRAKRLMTPSEYDLWQALRKKS